MPIISKSGKSSHGVKISLYAVRSGNMNGIFSRAEDFHRAISGFAGARYAVFSDPDDAIDFMGWKQSCPCSFLKLSNEKSESTNPSEILSSEKNKGLFVEVKNTNGMGKKSTILNDAYSDDIHSMNITNRILDKGTSTSSSMIIERQNDVNPPSTEAYTNLSSKKPSSSVLSNALSKNFSMDSSMIKNSSTQSSEISPIKPTSDVDDTEHASQDSSLSNLHKKRYWRQQPPGKTAKMYDRHFVQHNYHDFVSVAEEDQSSISAFKALQLKKSTRGGPRGGVSTPFPVKLHEMLENCEIDGHESIVAWRPHGRAFIIFKPKEFESIIMPKYFKQQSKHTSLQRQLNLYGFTRLSSGLDVGSYYHELFLRGKSFLLKRMVRTKVKGCRIKPASDPSSEPNFYSMTYAPYSSPSLRDVKNLDDNESHGEIIHSQAQIMNTSLNEKTSYPNLSMQLNIKQEKSSPHLSLDSTTHINAQTDSHRSSLMLIAEASVLLKESYHSS